MKGWNIRFEWPRTLPLWPNNLQPEWSTRRPQITF